MLCTYFSPKSITTVDRVVKEAVQRHKAIKEVNYNEIIRSKCIREQIVVIRLLRVCLVIIINISLRSVAQTIKCQVVG
jgi:hypothetical protein